MRGLLEGLARILLQTVLRNCEYSMVSVKVCSAALEAIMWSVASPVNRSFVTRDELGNQSMGGKYF